MNIFSKIIENKKAGFDLSDSDAVEKAIRSNGKNIRFILNPSHEMQKISIESDAQNIQYFDPDDEIKHLAVELQPNSIRYINDVSEELACFAVDKLPSSIRFIKPEAQTIKVCLKSICKNGKNLRYCTNQTEELIIAAVSIDAEALKYAQFQNERIVDAAIDFDGGALEFVLEEYKSEERCIRACRNNGKAITFVGKAQTYKECVAALSEDGMVIDQIYHPTHEMQRIAVLTSPEAIMLINNQPIDLCEISVRKDGLCLRLLDNARKTKKICDIALAQNPDAKQFLPTFGYASDDDSAPDVNIMSRGQVLIY